MIGITFGSIRSRRGGLAKPSGDRNSIVYVCRRSFPAMGAGTLSSDNNRTPVRKNPSLESYSTFRSVRSLPVSNVAVTLSLQQAVGVLFDDAASGAEARTPMDHN